MTLQFKIQLQNVIDPPVWRRVLVPQQFSFFRMHGVIQAAFGWENYHLFQFSPKGYGSYPIISMPYEDNFEDEKPLLAKKVKLQDIFITLKQKYVYIYDFGDDWKHLITLEKVTDEKIIRADCIAGKGACPPEDCGGPWGYENLKEILADTKHPEHYEMKEWLGMNRKQKWDAEAFDLEATKKLVAQV
jgi:Plasmid pRiA4b ORF-3-like protein